MALKNAYLIDLMNRVEQRNPNDAQFLITVRSVLESIEPVVEARPELIEKGVLELFVEPERVVTFRVPWVDDSGQGAASTAASACSSTAPSAPTRAACASIRRSTWASSSSSALSRSSRIRLTGLPIGGGKGGSDFDPKGKSDNEVMRFCQSFMTELYRHIGADTDVPAGDIGVGAPGDRLSVRPVQAPDQRRHAACSPARASPTAARWPAPRPPATACSISPRRCSKIKGDYLQRQDGRSSPAPATWPSTPAEKAHAAGRARSSPCRDSNG